MELKYNYWATWLVHIKLISSVNSYVNDTAIPSSAPSVGNPDNLNQELSPGEAAILVHLNFSPVISAWIQTPRDDIPFCFAIFHLPIVRVFLSPLYTETISEALCWANAAEYITVH